MRSAFFLAVVALVGLAPGVAAQVPTPPDVYVPDVCDTQSRVCNAYNDVVEPAVEDAVERAGRAADWAIDTVEAAVALAVYYAERAPYTVCPVARALGEDCW